jgi:hypothetical protein
MLLLERVTASVELGRSQKQNATVLYPLIESAYGCQFGAYVQALCRLPLTPNGAFTPAWKTLFLCSNSKVSNDGSTTTSTNESTWTSTEVAVVPAVVPTVVPAASEQPTELSEEQIISDCTIAYQQLCMTVSK